MTAFPLHELLRDVIDLLESKRVPYFVMGGIAVRYWGLPRPTFDLDFTIALDPGAVAELCTTFEQAGFTVPEIHSKGHLDTLQEMQKFSISRYERGKPVAIDLFVVTTQYQREAFARRCAVHLDGRPVVMIAPEDLILHKLIAARPRDLADVNDILLVKGDVDRKYMRTWAATLGIEDRLDKALDTVG